jgi:hypothetical protein
VTGSGAAAGLEEAIRPCPIEDPRPLDSSREGMLEGFSLGNDLMLVNDTGRLSGSDIVATAASRPFHSSGIQYTSDIAGLGRMIRPDFVRQTA